MTKIERIKALRNAVDPGMRLVTAARIVDAGEDHALIERVESERVRAYTKPCALRNRYKPAATLTDLTNLQFAVTYDQDGDWVATASGDDNLLVTGIGDNPVGALHECVVAVHGAREVLAETRTE